jgi:hypothetical protein
MAKLGFDPKKIKQYFQQHPLEIQWKQISYSEEDLSNIKKEIEKNKKEIVNIDNKSNNIQSEKMVLLNKEISLLKQKQKRA